MAEEGGYTIENIYQGGYSSLDPNKAYFNSFTGYRANAGSLGITTDPRTANMIKDASAKLSSGVKEIELTLVSPELYDAIPKQQYKEMRELSKLTGVDVSVHGPVIDTAGISQQGYDELNREMAERRISEFLQRIRDVNPDGNIPVTFHSAEGISGSEWKTLGEPGKEREAKRLIAIDRESGKMTQLTTETIFHPDMRELKPEIQSRIKSGSMNPEEFHGMSEREKYNLIPLEKGKLQKAEDRLQSINHTTWDDQINQHLFNKERADEILQNNQIQIQHLIEDINKGNINPENGLTPTQRQAYDHWMNARSYLEDTRQHVELLFNKAYKYGDEENKRILSKVADQFRHQLGEDKTPMGQSKAIQTLINNLKNSPPEMFVPIEKFAIEQSSKTFGNSAFNAYEKIKDVNKTPMVVIENPPAGMGLSTGEDLRNLVIASRERFVERAKEKGMNESQAKKIAEQLIGATWDVGHINMLRKQGFGDKEIIKESEKIAPYVKHVHLSDNFGLEHTELPMGMGNVPLKEIMEKLGKPGFEAKKVIEASSWWQHMQTNPLKESLEGMGSPMYTSGGGPGWNQSLGFYQNYSSGYGMMLPSNNYQLWGAGFSQLPSELGGDIRGGQGSRMSGRGME